MERRYHLCRRRRWVRSRRLVENMKQKKEKVIRQLLIIYFFTLTDICRREVNIAKGGNLRCLGTPQYFMSLLQDEIAFVTSCLLPWKKKALPEWSLLLKEIICP